MSKLNFFANLEEEVKSPKRKYQLFEARMGFETARVLVPLENADAFEEAALETKPKTQTTFLALAKKFGGRAE
jgi:hypothetical protein